MQLLPSPDLAHVVKHFLLLESGHSHARHCFFPDGNTGMAFHFGVPFDQEISDNATITQPTSFLYGQVNQFRHLTANGGIGLLIVVFQPYGVHSLLRMPAYELSGKWVDTRDIWGQDATVLEEKVLTATTAYQKIAFIEDFLRYKLTGDIGQEHMIQRGITTIYAHHGHIAVEELSQQLGINKRSLERLFREKVGITPKHFTNIIRLQHSLRLLRNRSAKENITGIAYECGYFDQSHFIREFRSMVGITPRQYLFNTLPLAVNFVQLQAGCA
ncbi:helix-turn-helix transcriptional regulator [Chitinophaga pendula]|uniref:helix-turn-helix transcriptional regulator n=1 Tax=Chitinophaga TaxID=79328 RepID=UPI0012FD1DAD|nr:MULTISPECIES: helix-turn-helix domain-containing protein [Chitinophaga]UCJ07861.1 helix-turn-helix transcriptional regulator [Chitinophaga pendula]